MKAISLFSSVLIATSTLLSVLTPASAHIAMSYPRGQAGPWTDDLRNTVHAWIGYEGKKFPCGGYKKGPVTKLNAGQTIGVEFWTFGMPYDKFPPPSNVKPARHGGGACEFSLSYDGGKTWKVIGQYTETCPDIYYRWPVQIPHNAPSCKDSNKCLFAMSWTAYRINQFYHHCANVEIRGVSGGKLPTLDMTVVNVRQRGQKQDTHADGDGGRERGPGPKREEVKRNTSGFYAFGGGAGDKGIDLGLDKV
ncbi:hypothetical protein BX616_002410 [Lobosporangium transversale]|uniref:Chitin-binding type-4 domain-containing protein n=1 Tax=Lobosporangium transversale TaxID=64571 RepID=A0A1Y2GJ42_9FUNG|nr:hypothetical protein BCR41DRAFT_388560 [Lobosporangium transversale]KAF9916925.1 hypothetical protein BX616_002410 [Lobosporangium transversale]ORZ08857.1 hypothetical protein BCR41DRAFT_388560 [Lobosporangium transversale]|eukprot:XP_021878640.1 hypothetical protein BCR41DRAFT_388560 [Lobosporangium transversale]